MFNILKQAWLSKQNEAITNGGQSQNETSHLKSDTSVSLERHYRHISLPGKRARDESVLTNDPEDFNLLRPIKKLKTELSTMDRKADSQIDSVANYLPEILEEMDPKAEQDYDGIERGEYLVDIEELVSRACRRNSMRYFWILYN